MSVPTLPFFETAAQHLVERVPLARPEETVGSVLASLPGKVFGSLEAVYIVEQENHLCGLVRLLDLMILPPEQKLKDVMIVSPPTVYPDDDQEEVATLAVQHRLAAVPVVAPSGRFSQSLIGILRREHIEDLHRLTGIQRENSHALHALEAPPLRRTRALLPWLLVGLAGSILATFVVSL
jgi:magnesium transporter